MRHEIIMPALGMAQDTGTLIAWHKAEGEAVKQGETLFEVETDKATMEVEAPASGFLVGVSARDGDEVPVGQVMALISDSATATEADKKTATPPAATPTERADSPALAALPEGHAVIMPVLGMAQDSGVLVRWNKALGDAIEQDEILFEVETDKSVVEVPAGKKGYLVARFAVAGDEVPTGETIAIISDELTENRVDKAYTMAADEPAATQEVQPAVEPPVSAAKPTAVKATTVDHRRTKTPAGKVLASPKLKRLAAQAGYDLRLLAETGHPQPFHAKDFEALKQANSAHLRSDGSAPIHALPSRLSARISAQEFASFLAWTAEHIEACSAAQVLATFAGASLAKHAVIRIDNRGSSATYETYQQLSATVPSDAEPDLIVHDLRDTYISATELQPQLAPVISIVGTKEELTLTLTCVDAQLPGKEAAVLLNNFAGRLADPLQHIF